MRLLLVPFLLAFSFQVFADEALSPAQEQRYQTLLGQLRCLVCQNQSIAESNAPLAGDLRRQVHDMVVRGDSDADIKRYLTDRYGEFVLYKPQFEPRTWLLWLGPFALLGIGLLVVFLLIRRSRTKSPEPTPDPEGLRRILEGKDSR